MNDARIELCPDDPAWPALFVAEQTLLASVLAPWLAGSMAHIGSTAVSGLAAKPVIDIMAPVVSLAASRDTLRRFPALAQAYAALKARLADAFADDREAYTQGKTAFVRQVLSGAAGGG